MSRTTEAPDAATLTPTQTADLCDSFCSHVCTYLATVDWQHVHDQRMKPIRATLDRPAMLPPEPGSPAYENHMKEFKRLHDVICQARHDFAEVEGPTLAAALERFEMDSAPVLSTINAHNPTGGGIEQVRARWQEKRIALQRAALQLRNLEGTPTLPASNSDRTPDTGPNTKTMSVPEITRVLYEWVLSEFPDAHKLTIRDLYPLIVERIADHKNTLVDDSSEARKWAEFTSALPPSPDAFAKSLRRAGVRRYAPKSKPPSTGSIVDAKQI